MSAYNGIHFYLDQYIGVNQPLDLDHGRRRANLAKDFAVRSSNSLPIGGNIYDEHARANDILDCGTNLFQSCSNDFEDELCLSIRTRDGCNDLAS